MQKWPPCQQGGHFFAFGRTRYVCQPGGWVLPECVYSRDYLGSLFVGEGRRHREREFLAVDALGDGEQVRHLQQSASAVAFLGVGWDGVVDQCLYAMVGKMLLQLVSPGA